MAVNARRQVATLLLLVLMIAFTCGVILPAAAARAKVVADPASLEKEEQAAVAELLRLKLQIESARSEIEHLEGQLHKNLAAKTALEKELEQIRADLDASNKELGRWVSFTYRYGYTSLLEVLFTSADFGDFLNRSFLLWSIMDERARVFQANRALRKQAENSLAKINDLNQLIVANKTELEKNITGLENARAGMEQQLAELKRKFAETGAKLNEVAEQWAEVTSLTSEVVRGLSSVLGSEIMPDSINFTPGGIRAVFSETTINKAILKSTVEPARVGVDIEPGQVKIAGNTGDRGVSFELQGNFEASRDGKKIIFVPGGIAINNSRLDGYISKIITENTDFDWEITSHFPSLAISRVQTGNGRITVDLKYLNRQHTSM